MMDFEPDTLPIDEWVAGMPDKQRIKELEAQKTRSQEHYIKLLMEKEVELATLKKKARSAVNAPYDDILDMGLAQALRELEEGLPQETKDARPSYDERVDEWKEMHRSDGE